MHLLIDGDVLLYKCGFGAMKSNKGGEVPVTYALHNLNSQIKKIRKYIAKHFNLNQLNTIVFISSTDRSNFRYQIAKTLEYKANRKDKAKPQHFEEMRQFLVSKYNARVVHNMEADDEMGIIACEALKNHESVCIVSIDKDMRMIPGWHWEIGLRPPFFVEDPGFLDLEQRGSRKKLFGTGFAFFAAQCLIGDTADNIPGIPKVGDVKAFNILHGADTVDTYWERVKQSYSEFDIPEEQLLETATLLWIRRERITNEEEITSFTDHPLSPNNKPLLGTKGKHKIPHAEG